MEVGAIYMYMYVHILSHQSSRLVVEKYDAHHSPAQSQWSARVECKG